MSQSVPADSAVLSRDTSGRLERLQINAWRALSSVEIAQLVARASRLSRALALAGLRERHPGASDRELVARLALLTWARTWHYWRTPSWRHFQSLPPRERSAGRRAHRDAALEAQQIRYTVGGSLASSFSGEPRATVDVDIVIDMSSEQIGPFVEALGDDFYVDGDALRRAVSTRSTANVLHRLSAVKMLERARQEAGQSGT